MKHTITITFDDEAKIVEVAESGGKVTRLKSANLTVERKPIADREAEEREHGYQIFKPGPVMEIHLIGYVV